ncbi:kelch repeat-containing protein [Agriterribacter sp.]|uniref:kelch repeat-containing protein n=1 Tax=Agriterribacter sp. TaxID=2821509 RepID=UPI002C6BDBAC|nr:kelch repeat-containing protein [Agriterribacter sp.]HRO47213.1 kelch repeat-containing protein [Agriterribacter sp.]HRQ18429.1 kelch repeat-containing protein [Agriterribacter sp.]
MMKLSLLIFLSSMMMPLHSCKNQEQKYTMAWRIAGELPPLPGQEKAIGLAGPVAGVTNNVLLVAGGANFPDSLPWMGGKKRYYAEGFVMKRIQEDSLSLYKTFSLPYPLAYPACASTPMGIVCAGGENPEGVSSKVMLLQWGDHSDSVIITNLPDLPLPLSNAGITIHDNIIYLAGGENSDSASSGFYSLDITNAAARWNTLPSLPYAVSHAVVVAQFAAGSPSVYVLGGRKKNSNSISDIYASAYAFDLNKKEWKEIKSLPYRLCAGTGIAAGKNEILLFGGDKGETFHKTELLIGAINAATDTAEQQDLIRQKNQLQAAHPGFSREVLRYNTTTDNWTNTTTLPFEAPVTTTAILWNNDVVIPNGEIRAGVRTPEIWMRRIQ